MATLDRWRAFLATPKALTFPRLELLGRDHAPPIVVGAGEVRMVSPNDFAFTLTGTPADIPYALAEINRQRENPYDGLARFRLEGVDADGVKWSGGYTVPRVDAVRPAFTFTGEIESLVTDDQSPTTSQESSTELIFLLRIGDPMSLAMARFVGSDQGGRELLNENALNVLGSRIRFTFEASAGALAITASHSPNLLPTYTENWLGEPLRIMFGQLIYPRLVARNFGNGRASVWVRRSPSLIPGAHWAALWAGDELAQDSSDFWSRYAHLLSLIARARGKDGHPNFEPHKITRLYEECIQAARGSRWVWALTFASSIEGLVKMLIKKKAGPAPAEDESTAVQAKAIEALVKHINLWPGEDRLPGACGGRMAAAYAGEPRAGPQPPPKGRKSRP